MSSERRQKSASSKPWLAARVSATALLLAFLAPYLGAERVSTARSWVVAGFHADIQVHRDGRTEISETIRVRFDGSYNGVFRTIPIIYRNSWGGNYKLRLTIDGVEDDRGNELEYEVSRERNYRKLKIWVPGAENATRTVVIRYTVGNALRFMEEEGEAWDELYWNVTGDEWPVGIEAASARIQLPSRATGVRARAFTGAYRSTELAAEIRIEDHVIHVGTTRPLGMHEGLTVAVAWDSREAAGLAAVDGNMEATRGPPTGDYLVRRPSFFKKLRYALEANWPLFIPILAFFAMYSVWIRTGRDPQRRPITVQYEPPEGMTPSEIGVLVDNRTDMRDVTAMIVDLAVRGYLTIEESEKTLLGFSIGKDYEFELQRGRSDWDEDLKRHETRLLDAMFDGRAGDVTSVSEMENSFYQDLPDIKNGIFAELMARRYYRSRPDRTMAKWVVAGAIAAPIILVPGLAIGTGYGMSPITLVLAAVLTAVVIISFGVFMPARTIAGTRALEQSLGFEEFLNRVESERYRRMITGPEMFERYLPYAMALGVEKKWAAAFSEILKEPPSWNHGAGAVHFRPTLFVGDLSGMSTKAASAMSSAPRSSGGSGFSGGGGGGFSGGGFGGGGGGAF